MKVDQRVAIDTVPLGGDKAFSVNTREITVAMPNESFQVTESPDAPLPEQKKKEPVEPGVFDRLHGVEEPAKLIRGDE